MVEHRTLLGRMGYYGVYAPVLLLAVVVLMPYLWMVIGAFKPVPELSKSPPTFYIENPTLNNFYDELGGKSIPNHVEGISSASPTRNPMESCRAALRVTTLTASS